MNLALPCFVFVPHQTNCKGEGLKKRAPFILSSTHPLCIHACISFVLFSPCLLPLLSASKSEEHPVFADLPSADVLLGN